LAWYAATEPTSALPIFLMVVGYGTARAFAFPATRALPADTVPATRLPWLVARQSMSWQAASIVGPGIGGFLFVVDVSLPFLVAAGLLVVAAVAITLVQPIYHVASEPVAPDLAAVEIAERQGVERDSTESALST